MTNFIFMLTKNDLTIRNARDVFEEIKDSGVRHIGFKDIGLPLADLKVLVRGMKEKGMTTYLEVVSESEEANMRSVKSAIELGVDNLIGGMYVEQTLNYFRETKSHPKFYPYVGKIIGHPCLLRGELSDILADAKKKEALGIDGINLLAYRYDGDVEMLTGSLLKTVTIPVIVAGSIDSFDRIKTMSQLGVEGFTIGGAIFDKKFIPNGSLTDQLNAVLNATRG